ncbi:MAG: hypothetical protein M3066_03095 [Actinomycetota bacterium]|nr:hypothetical protein [Actinomycetota bacterium]
MREDYNNKVAEIEKAFPEEDLRGGDYGVYNREQQSQMRYERARLMAAAKVEYKRKVAIAAERQAAKAEAHKIGGGRTTDADHSAIANVRSLLDNGASPRKLAKQFSSDDVTLKALRWLVETGEVGGNSATDEQADQLGGSSDNSNTSLLHFIDKFIDPERAEQAEREAIDAVAANAMANGSSTATAVQAAKLAAARIG